MVNPSWFLVACALLSSAESQAAASKSRKNPACPTGHFCAQAPEGLIEVVSCPGYTFHCSGVDWKSEEHVSVVFELSSPDGDPSRDRMVNVSLNGSRMDDIDLTRKTTSCGKDSGAQEWSLKREGAYSRFKLGSKCGSEAHSFDAVCQELICTQPLPK